MPLHRLAVDPESSGKGFDRGEEPLLEARDEQGGGRLLAFGLGLEPLLAQLAVLVEQDGELQLGGIGGKAVDVDLPDNAFRKAALDGAEVLLQAADHDIVEQSSAFLTLDGNPPDEALGVEDFEEGGEAVGVAVVGRRREEQAVLEPPGQVANGSGDLRVDGVLRARWTERRGGPRPG